MAGRRIWDVIVIVLLIGSVGLVFWHETLDVEQDAGLRTLIEWADLALVAFFLLEWGWRVRARRRSEPRYALRNSWELLGMIPIIAPLPAFLRALRLVRVLRVLRGYGQFSRPIRTWERVLRRSGTGKIVLISGLLTVGGSTLVWLFEKDTNPDLADWSEAVWWGIVTVTTVGYGDITPDTMMGRFVASVLMITGIGVIGLLASTTASVLVTDRRARRERNIASDLARLAQLHSDGKLDDDEFRLAKERVLTD